MALVRVVLTVGFLLAAGLAGGDEPKTIDSVEAEIQATNKRLQALDQEIAENRSLKTSLEQAVQAVESRVSDREHRIRGLDKDIDKYSLKLDKLELQVQDAQRSVALRKERLARSIRRSQQLGTGSGLKVLLQHDNPALADRLGVYTDYFLRAQNASIEAEIAALQKIDAAKQTTLKDRNWLNHIKRKASGQYENYRTQQKQKLESLDKVEKQITEKNRSVATLKADQARLSALMEELKALAIAQSGYFESGKGNYLLPVSGTIKARFGDVKSVGRLHWNGLFVAAPVGRPVKAVADGEVVYSDWLQGFGMLVILDHGDDYMTLYGGNRDVIVADGTWIDAGATIATVGDSGGQTDSGVYFEVRHNAKPVDPEQWINTDNRLQSAKN